MAQKTIDGRTYQTFDTWEAVQTAVSQGVPLWYWAPLDYKPVRVTCILKHGNRVRVLPPTSDVDPFFANRDHLPRFYVRVANLPTWDRQPAAEA